MATPGAVQAGFSQQVYTAFEYVQKYGTNEEKRYLMQRHNYPKNFYMMLDQLGLVRPSNGSAKIWHLEDDWLTDNVTVGSIITPAAGADTTMVIALSADNMINKTGFNGSYPQINQQIIVPVTGEIVNIVAKDTTTNPAVHRLSLRPEDPTVNLLGKIVAGATYAIIGNSYAEGTRGAKSVISVENYYENYYQIFKKSFQATGTSMTLDAPFKVVDMGEGRSVFIARNTHNAEKRHWMDISNTLLVGKKSNVRTAPSEGADAEVTVYKTEGLWTGIKNQGFTLPTTGGVFGLDEFDAAANFLEGERVPGYLYMFLMGHGLEGEIENNLIEFGAGNAGTYKYAATGFKPAVLDGQDPEDFFTWIGFSGIKKRGRQFLFKTLTDFGDPKGLGTTGYEYKNSGMIVPYATMDNKNKNGKTNTPSIGAEYCSLGGYERKFEIVKTGGADMINPTSDLDAKKWDILSEMGGDFGLLGQCIAIEGDPTT